MQAMQPPYAREPWGPDGSGAPGRGRSPWLVLLLVAGLVLGGYWLINAARNAGGGAAQTTAGQARLTLREDDGGHRSTILRDDAPHVYYRVVLAGAPVGRRLALTCDWVDPAGRLVHRNRYETREITRPDWPTHAQYRFGPTSPTGSWTVRLAHGGRRLIATDFVVAAAATSGPSPVTTPSSRPPNAGRARRIDRTDDSKSREAQ